MTSGAAVRAQLRDGEVTPAVADADADYERMWAQDAAAMYAYARASASEIRRSRLAAITWGATTAASAKP
ncbi:hypothetical protein MAHJHV57_52090 [Mycobacterium avium subsp. hominissuis]